MDRFRSEDGCTIAIVLRTGPVIVDQR